MGEFRLGSICYITLWVKTFDACLIFYRDLLGLPLVSADENFAQFSTSGTYLYLHRLGEAPPLRDHSLEIHFAVPDVDQAYTELVRRGLKFESAPADMPWGIRMAACRDPEGFQVEIVGPLKG